MKALRALVKPALVVVAWQVAEWASVASSAHEGLLASFGPVRLAPLGVGVIAVGLRVVATFVVAPWAGYRLTAWRRVAPASGRARAGR
jgi:hypothetical protein